MLQLCYADIKTNHIQITLLIGYGLGAVHKVRHAIFGQFLSPSPCYTLSHIPGPQQTTAHISDPPIFSRPSTKTRTKAPCKNSLSIVRGRYFVWGGFYPFPLLSESIPPSVRIRLLQQKVRHYFKFHVSYV